jgi:hypothetical protein
MNPNDEQSDDADATAWPVPTEEQVRRMAQFFAGLDDRHGRYVLNGNVNADGKREGAGKNLQGGPSLEMWRDHLAGKERLGVIPIRRDGTAVFGVIDIDNKDKPDHVRIAHTLSQHSLYFPVCRSKSNAAHVYLFVKQPVPACKMRARLREIAKLIGHADAEIFPVQEDLHPGDCGSYINVPYFSDTCRMVINEERDATLEDFLNYIETIHLDPEWFERSIGTTAEENEEEERESVRFELPDVIPEGHADNMFKAVAVRMRKFFGCSEAELYAILAAMNANPVRMANPKKDAPERISKSIARQKTGDNAERLPLQITVNRSGTLLELARSLYSWNHTEAEIAATLAAVNKQRCGDPPLSDDKMKDIPKRALKMHKRKGAAIGTDSKKLDLFALAEDFEYFNTGTMREPYIRVKKGEHHEVCPAGAAKGLLTIRYLEKTGRAPAREALVSAVDTVMARCAAGPLRDVYVRIARSPEAIYIDMGDESWRAIEITRDDWRIVDPPDRILFRRPSAALPLPEPVRGGSLVELKELLNVDADQFVLACAWLLGVLQPTRTCDMVHLVIEGVKGTAKTSAMKSLIMLLDPSGAIETVKPKCVEDVLLSARDCAILGYDNLSGCSNDLSDALCSLSTGGALKKRTLYQTSDVSVIGGIKRPIIMNGIDAGFLRGDLADRSIVLSLLQVAFKERGELAELFGRLHPRILGALCTAASTGLRHLSSTKLSRPLRMGGFAKWVLAGEPSLPWKSGRFLKLYDAQLKEGNLRIQEEDQVAAALVEYWREYIGLGGMKEMLMHEWHTELTRIINRPGHARIDYKHWPANATSLSKYIPRIVPALAESGLFFEKLKRNNAGQPWRFFSTPLQAPPWMQQEFTHDSLEPFVN